MKASIYFIIILFVFSCNQKGIRDQDEAVYDVVVYGSTPAGIAAAVTASRNGKQAVIIDPHKRIGGLPASGMSNTDFRSFESLRGVFKEFTDSVANYYKITYGPDSDEFYDCRNGTKYEPKIALRIFKNMISKAGVTTETELILEDIKRSENNKNIKEIKVRNINSGKKKSFNGKIFIDASYEGDLMAMAGEEYVLGAEPRHKYNESLATEEGDDHVMAYNYRVAVTKDPNNRIEFDKPEGYDTTDYPILLEGFKTGRFTQLRQVIGIYEIPNKKANLNDRHSADTESFMLYNESDKWPEATYEERLQLEELARFKAKSYFYFLSHDERLPDSVRTEMSTWGYPEDEFEDNNHFPPWLYVREGRRMVGEYIFTQHDGSPEKGSVRAPAHETAISVGDYNFNSHGSHLDSEGHKVGMLKGKPTVPYQVPYGVILPEKTDNLLVPVAVSASRIGFSTIRMEPTWTALGEAAGMSAVISLNHDEIPRDIDIVQLQTKLHEAGAITFYVSDVPPGSRYFKAVQFLGNRGFFQHLYPDTLNPYTKEPGGAFAFTDVNTQKKLTEELKSEWIGLVGKKFGEEMKEKAIEIAENSRTRGEFIISLYEEIQ